MTSSDSQARRFAATAESVSEVRAFVRSALGDLVVDHAAVLLMADELAANAVRHARTPFTVRIVLESFAVRVEVADDDPRFPVVRDPDPLATGGRGMLIVDRCATDWGIENHPDNGKTVWFESRQLAI